MTNPRAAEGLTAGGIFLMVVAPAVVATQALIFLGPQLVIAPALALLVVIVGYLLAASGASLTCGPQGWVNRAGPQP